MKANSNKTKWDFLRELSIDFNNDILEMACNYNITILDLISKIHNAPNN